MSSPRDVVVWSTICVPREYPPRNTTFRLFDCPRGNVGQGFRDRSMSLSDTNIVEGGRLPFPGVFAVHSLTVEFLPEGDGGVSPSPLEQLAHADDGPCWRDREVARMAQYVTLRWEKITGTGDAIGLPSSFPFPVGAVPTSPTVPYQYAYLSPYVLAGSSWFSVIAQFDEKSPSPGFLMRLTLRGVENPEM